MRNALIDIGSNTIRLVIYEGIAEILNTAVFAGLISEVKDGKISPEGINKITNTLIAMKKKATEAKCDNIYAFATASLRDIDEKDELCSLIKFATGVDVEIITGDEEARYDYLGIRSMYNETDGVAFDLGGGSCQLLMYERDLVREFMSLKIGSLKLYDMFVSGVLPTESEIEDIKKHVRKNLSKLSLMNGCGFEKIYAMGGAAFALNKIATEKYGKALITEEVLMEISEISEEELERLNKNRLTTLIPAAVTIIEIMRFTGVKYIIPVTVGVRDGILYDKFLKNNE